MKERQANSPGWYETEKERNRFYLLPGMGGRAARRKHKIILLWSIAAGILVSLVVAGGFYLINRFIK